MSASERFDKACEVARKAAWELDDWARVKRSFPTEYQVAESMARVAFAELVSAQRALVEEMDA